MGYQKLTESGVQEREAAASMHLNSNHCRRVLRVATGDSWAMAGGLSNSSVGLSLRQEKDEADPIVVSWALLPSSSSSKSANDESKGIEWA